jgi:hypothetical protein
MRSAHYSLLMRRGLRRRNTSVSHGGDFCSALVASALQTIGVLAAPEVSTLSSNPNPADFSSSSPAAYLPLVAPFAYLPEIVTSPRPEDWPFSEPSESSS